MTATLEAKQAKQAELAAIKARTKANINGAAREMARINASSLTLQFELMQAKARLELVKADTANVVRRLANEDRRAG